MRIKEMIWQRRRDFEAIFECEHCGENEKICNCYDDRNFHENVIPAFKCKKCGRMAKDDYTPKSTKYSDHQIV